MLAYPIGQSGRLCVFLRRSKAREAVDDQFAAFTFCETSLPGRVEEEGRGGGEEGVGGWEGRIGEEGGEL